MKPLLRQRVAEHGAAGPLRRAALEAWLLELGAGRTRDQAGRSAVGAGVGRLQGTAVKLAIGALMWIVIAVAAFWP